MDYEKENSIKSANNSKNYYADSQKKYNAKNKIYSIKFIGGKESKEIEMIESAILKSGLSANSWIKKAMHEKLKRDEFLK